MEDMEDMEDADFDLQDGNVTLRRQASLDALKLYSGAFASSETPMNRFMAMSPSHDTHAWMARSVMDESGMGLGDLESVDLRKLASEMVNLGEQPRGTREANAGSPRPSSDTLSWSRFNEVKNARKEAARPRKRIGNRKQSVADRTKKSNSHSTAK